MCFGPAEVPDNHGITASVYWALLTQAALFKHQNQPKELGKEGAKGR